MAERAAAPTPTTPSVKFLLSIPEHIYDSYAERATKFGRTAEEEIALRLKVCMAYTATTPIYFSDQERNDLSQIAGKLLRHASDVIAWARHLSTIRVNDCSVTLPERLLARLQGRTFGQTLDNYLEHKILELLEQEVGLR